MRRTVTDRRYPLNPDELTRAHCLDLQRLRGSVLAIRHSTNRTALHCRDLGSLLPGNGVGGAGAHWNGQNWRPRVAAFRLKSQVAEVFGTNAIPEGMQAIRQWHGKPLDVGSHGSNMSCGDCPLGPTDRSPYGRPLLRMSVGWKPTDIRMTQFMKRRTEATAQAMGRGSFNSSCKDSHYDIRSCQTTHYLGGAVMEADPATSAVNRYLQGWNLPNLRLSGTSAFQQNIQFNPTYAVGALTYRMIEAHRHGPAAGAGWQRRAGASLTEPVTRSESLARVTVIPSGRLLWRPDETRSWPKGGTPASRLRAQPAFSIAASWGFAKSGS